MHTRRLGGPRTPVHRDTIDPRLDAPRSRCAFTLDIEEEHAARLKPAVNVTEEPRLAPPGDVNNRIERGDEIEVPGGERYRRHIAGHELGARMPRRRYCH